MEGKTPVLAILALVFSIIFPLAGIVLAIIALVKAQKDPEKKGKTLAIVALIISILLLPIMLLMLIGSIAYFGVLSPQEMLPDRCKFGSPILCQSEQYTIQSQGTGDGSAPTISMEVTNNYGENVMIGNFEVSSRQEVCDSYYVCLDSDNNKCDTEKNLANNKILMEAGASYKLLIDCSKGSALESGDRAKFNIEGSWRPETAGETFTKPVSGEIYAEVQ